MKKLTVLLATLFMFLTGDAQQILAGIYSGTMYNDSTKMLQKYELALSEYRGKVFGYSYVTFIVNDTFYYGVRRVKGHKNDNNELVLEDEELLANNFPESPAKRVRRTATFPLAQEDTITSLKGTWQTNRTRQYYSVGGATKTERTVDSTESALVMHLKELNIISDKPNYQDDAVAKKKKDEKKPKDTEVAKRRDNKVKKEAEGSEAEKALAKNSDPATAPDKKDAIAGTTPGRKEPTTGTTPEGDKAAVAAADRQKPGNTTGQPEAKTGTAPATKETATPSTRTEGNAVASETVPVKDKAVAAGQETVAANKEVIAADKNTSKEEGASRPAGALPAGDKNTVAAADKKAATDKPGAAGAVTNDRTAGTSGAPATGRNEAVTRNEGDKKAVTTDNAVARNADPKKEGEAAASGDAGKPVNLSVNGDNNTAVDPTTGDLIIRKPANAANKPLQNASTPVSGTETAKAADKKATDAKKEAVAAPSTTQPEGKPATNAAGKNEDKAAVAASEPNRTEKAPAAVAATIPDSRTSAVIKVLEVVNDSITLSFYDNGVVDGDVISVFVNGQNIVGSARLNEVAIKKTVHLTNFASDSVEVTLVAETLGSIPPNTGLLLVRDGDKRYDVRFSADMKTNASIIFRKVKK